MSSMAPPKSFEPAAPASSAAKKTPVLWVIVLVPREVLVVVEELMFEAVMSLPVSRRTVTLQKLFSES